MFPVIGNITGKVGRRGTDPAVITRLVRVGCVAFVGAAERCDCYRLSKCDLMQSSCVNDEIRPFSRKLMKSVRAYQHTSILEVVSDRKFFTNHGLPLKGLGKDVLSKQIVAHT